MQICPPEKCTGCFACRNACLKDAICVGYNNISATIPIIDEAKCVNCGLCQKICPVNAEPIFNTPKKSFAVLSCLPDDKLSSSGAAAAVMARFMIKNGGVVYGAAVENKDCSHIRVDKPERLNLLRGSKYVQSSIGFSFRQVKNDLQQGLSVIFFGTPCQIAGLKAFLRNDYDNLITVDLICHGTPPHRMLEEHINSKCKQYDSYSFRGKYDFILTVYNNQFIVYQASNKCDEYFTAFLSGLNYRDICYNCSYAKIDRISDITVGDFWGLDKVTLKEKFDGRISLLLPNTSKGEMFFEEIKKFVIWEERTVKEAANEQQGQLLHPTVPHNQRKEFLQNYAKYGFDRAVMKTTLGKDILKNKIKNAGIYRVLAKVRRHIF